MSKLKRGEFVQKSLDLNLFFLRIMKEHSFFLQTAFISRDEDLVARADRFRGIFEELLDATIALADGNASRVVLKSGEVVTDHTLPAEKEAELLTGVPFDTNLTGREAALISGAGDPELADEVAELNRAIIDITEDLIKFKTKILEGRLECCLFTWHFPLLIGHIRREAIFFVNQLVRLQRGEYLDFWEEIITEKIFWDRIMAEHSLFIANLLDPSEINLIETADDFASRFFKLESRTQQVENLNGGLPIDLLQDEIRSTREIRDFKTTTTELILDCEIKSIMVPLLADHVSREANHFLAILSNNSAPIIDDDKDKDKLLCRKNKYHSY